MLLLCNKGKAHVMTCTQEPELKIEGFALDGVCLLEELPLARHSLGQRGLLLLLLLAHVLAPLDPRVGLPTLALFAATF